MTLLRTALTLVLLVAATGPALAQEPAAEDRPCGPKWLQGPLKYLIPQGFAGADFKPACRCHDRCYAAQPSRPACDAQFLRDLDCACESSRSKTLCRVVARVMHGSVRLFGGLSKPAGP